nr:hypothetical protein Iba_chr04cCG13120 [Ipomoea batatas]
MIYDDLLEDEFCVSEGKSKDDDSTIEQGEEPTSKSSRQVVIIGELDPKGSFFGTPVEISPKEEEQLADLDWRKGSFACTIDPVQLPPSCKDYGEELHTNLSSFNVAGCLEKFPRSCLITTVSGGGSVLRVFIERTGCPLKISGLVSNAQSWRATELRLVEDQAAVEKICIGVLILGINYHCSERRFSCRLMPYRRSDVWDSTSEVVPDGQYSQWTLTLGPLREFVWCWGEVVFVIASLNSAKILLKQAVCTSEPPRDRQLPTGPPLSSLF